MENKNSSDGQPFVIAEIGCNHGGDFAVATEMVEVAARFCKVAAVKFQKRNPKVMLSAAAYASPHPNPHHAFGRTYGEHREALELSIEAHRRLQGHAQKCGVKYSSSVWDLPSAEEVASLSPPFIKVPSACNLDLALLEFLCNEYGGQIHISLGMTSRPERERIVGFMSHAGRLADTVLYVCTSSYPAPFEELYLLEISSLVSDYGADVKGIGFSGHHLGIAADVAALALGARYFERHFTLDRTSKGTDHAASLEPDGLRRLTRDLLNVSKGLQRRPEGITPSEKGPRAKLRTKQTL